MAFISIDGYNFPPPKRGVKPTIITLVNSGRNTNGAVIGQKVGRDQYKLDNLEWPWLPAEKWEQMLQILERYFVHVTFYDMKTGAKKTLKMYPGDRTAEPYFVDDDGKPQFYRNCKVNLIDCGEE